MALYKAEKMPAQRSVNHCQRAPGSTIRPIRPLSPSEKLGRAPQGGHSEPGLECRQFNLLRAVQEVVEEHPAPFHSLRILADYDVLQVVGSVQTRQGQEEAGFCDYQVQVDLIAAEKVNSAAKRLIPESIVIAPELLDDLLSCDGLEGSTFSNSLDRSELMLWNKS